jgi:ADP-heptose:LPS heptosyltransferase
MNPWLTARNLLAVRLDNAGDMVMLGPALRAIKRTSPEARLTVLATPAGASVAPLLPWVDDVLVWRPVWQDLGRSTADPARDRHLIELLKERDFDAAFIFTSFRQDPHVPGYVCYLAGIPLRAGASKEFAGATLTDELPSGPDEIHQVERNLDLIERLGFRINDRQLALALPDEARASAAELLRGVGLEPEAPFALVHPGASAAARRYPPERFAAVAAELRARGLAVLITGMEREADAVGIVSGQGTLPALVGATSLAELAAIVAMANVVICGNTLLLHLADALNTPVVCLFAGTDLESQWGPRRAPNRLMRVETPCHPCYLFDCPIGQPCLDIAPHDVANAALQLTFEQERRAPALAKGAVS